jgi:DNA repair exonuclease SbcCD ATPase subunit
MIPVKLTLHNFCQYSHLEYTYLPGITGVIGNNGTGKTNFLDTGQFFSITGESDRSRADLLQWGKISGYTEFVFKHTDVSYTLTRNLHDAGAILKWIDNKGVLCKERGITKIQAILLEMLEMSFDVLKETRFCGQEGLISVFKMTHASRMAYFQRLAGITKTEILRDKLQDAVSSLEIKIDRSVEIAKLKEEIDAKTDAKLKLEVDKTKLSADLKPSKDANLLESISNWLKLPLERVKEAKVKLATAYLNTKIQAYDIILKSKPVTVEEVTLPTNLEEQYKLYLQRQSNLTYYKEQEDKLAKIVTDLSALPKITEPDKTELNSVNSILTESKPEYRLAVTGKCPTCNRVYTLKKTKEDIIKAYEDLEIKQRELSLRYNTELTAYNQNKIAVDSLSNSMNNTLNLIEDLDKKLKPTDELSFDLDTYTKLKSSSKAWIEYKFSLKDWELKLSKAKTEVDNAKINLEAEVKIKCITEEQKLKHELTRNYILDLQNELKTVNDSLLVITTEISEKTKLFAAYTKEQNEYTKFSSTKAYLYASREVLHRDCLPKEIMRRMLKNLNAHMEYYLSRFDTTFNVEVTESFDFSIEFPDKTTGPEVLSCGQRVALAVAFRLALADLVSKTVPILVLDEPTVWLDKTNIGKMADVMTLVRNIAEKGMFIMVATHEESLMNSMSRVLDISKITGD